MKASFVIGALAAMVGIGSATYMLVGAEDDEPTAKAERKRAKGKRAAKASAAPVEDRSDWEMDDRVAELEAEVASLRAEVRTIRMRAGASAAFGAGGDDPILELEDPAVAESVREIVAEEREREREQEMERRRERAQERMNEALEELVAQANVNADQREKIGTLWNDERDQMFSLFAEARSGDRDFRDIREEARQLRRNTDEQAKAMLSDEQYQVYEELRPRGPGRGGRGPRGPSAGGPSAGGPSAGGPSAGGPSGSPAPGGPGGPGGGNSPRGQ
jgi:hypothetical protein